MKNNMFAEYLITRVDWTSLHELDGDGRRVRDALTALLSATNVEQTEAAYWQIENHAVVQGTVYEVAEACTSVLIASLMDEHPKFVRVAVLDLLFQILSGSAAPSSPTPADVVERCRRTARHGLWLLVREREMGEVEAARDVLAALGETDRILG